MLRWRGQNESSCSRVQSPPRFSLLMEEHTPIGMTIPNAVVEASKDQIPVSLCLTPVLKQIKECAADP